MNILTPVLVFSVIMGVVAFVVGSVLSVRLLRGATVTTAPPWEARSGRCSWSGSEAPWSGHPR